MTFKPSARMIARRSSINIAGLIDILSYRRCYETDGEAAFLEDIIDNIKGIQSDDFGNRYISIPKADGSPPDILWSCHTDSVHSPRNNTIFQNIRWDPTGNILGLNEGKAGQCLGADDGCGIWLMMEMLEEGKPGLYVFHRAEECGGKGSRWLLANTPELLKGIKYAIAFDRKDLSSVITHQGGYRCCSDKFGNALAAALSRPGELAMKLDQTGSFTDTAVYTGVIPECTNISVGYYNQHGPRETVNVMHMIRLRQAILQLNPDEDFVVDRVAGTKESRWPTYSYKPNQNKVVPFEKKSVQTEMDNNAWGKSLTDEEAYEKWQTERFGVAAESKSPSPTLINKMLNMVREFPKVAAKMLLEAGFDHIDYADAVFLDEDEDDADLADPGEGFIKCENCNSKVDIIDVDDDLRCIHCYASLKEPFLEAIEAQDSATLQDIENARCI